MAAKGIVVIGKAELEAALDGIQKRLQDDDRVSSELAVLMQKDVPVRTGHLKSTIYHKAWQAGADAPYAGFVADREKSAYADSAIDAFDADKYLAWLVEPF